MKKIQHENSTNKLQMLQMNNLCEFAHTYLNLSHPANSLVKTSFSLSSAVL